MFLCGCTEDWGNLSRLCCVLNALQLLPPTWSASETLPSEPCTHRVALSADCRLFGKRGASLWKQIIVLADLYGGARGRWDRQCRWPKSTAI